MSYYEQLNVSTSASKMEIKKAYFKRTKEFPPERFPEEFKEIRKAYEALSDDAVRAQHDQMIDLSKDHQSLYNSAEEAMKVRDYAQVIKLLKDVVKNNPEHEALTRLLGDAYLKNENTGNAIKIFETLVKQHPQNVEYRGKLAKSYIERKFIKKAITHLEELIALEPDNILYLKMLAEVYSSLESYNKATQLYEQAIKVAPEDDVMTLELHIGVIMLAFSQEKPSKIGNHLEMVKKAVRNNLSYGDHIFDTLLDGILELPEATDEASLDNMDAMIEIINFLHEINPNHELVSNLKEQADEANVMRSLETDKNIIDGIKFLTGLSLKDCPCDGCDLNRAFIQLELLEENRAKLEKSIKHVQTNYPDIYEMNESFYQKVVNPKMKRKLVDEINKTIRDIQKRKPKEFSNFMKSQLGDDEIDFDFDSSNSILDDIPNFSKPPEPFVRQGPKVGRNDPCPCGSGKKYKKCCG